MEKILWVLYIFLFCFGFQNSFSILEIEKGTYVAYFLSIVASSLILIYLIPFLYGIKLLIRKINADWKGFVGAFVSGSFIAAPVCIITNEIADELWLLVLSQNDFLKWGNALTGSISEEIIKAAICLLFILVMKFNKMKDYFICGIGVGMGFQVMEDITFIFPQIMSDEALNDIVLNAFDRISTSISSHWIYTAVMLVGIYLISKTADRAKGFLYIIFVFLLHFIWNSPLPIMTPILSTITILLFIKVLKDVLADINEQAG